MPIIRTYACADCNHMMEVMLSPDQWDAEPPECPECQRHAMRQEFKPVAIAGSVRSKAVAIAEDIISNDYNVADFKAEAKEGHAAKVRYKDQPASAIPASSWTAATETIQHAIAYGRDTRLRYGNGLDVLQAALKSGAQPDLIAQSKRRAIKVW